MLRLSQPNAEQGYAVPASYPTTAAPMVQPAPTPVYYPSQPQYRYPAQPQATAMYQPYQPGAQYRYPGPYSRPPMRTAAVDPSTSIQPIPAQPGMGPGASPGLAPNDGTAPQTAGVMNQMLAEGSGCGYGGCQDGCGQCGPYRGTTRRFEHAACGPYSGSDGYCGDGRGCPWYASVSALALSRNEGRRLWTSYDASNDANQLTNTQDIHLPWKWGGEIRLGRRYYWCDSTWAVEATYWSTEAFSGFVSTTSPNPPFLVSTPLRVFEVQFNGFPATAWFDNAREHRLWRRDEFQNIEVNLIREQLNCACNAPWDIGWSLGVRYFRFEENLTFASLQDGGNWGQQGGIREAYLNDTITNNLLGFQFGFDAAYCLADGMRLFVCPKVGIYNDRMNQNFRAYLGNGAAGTTGTSGVPGTFPVLSSRDGLAFLTQIDLGADWQFSQHWSARVGYRVVAITGIALADDQFPQYIVDVPEIAHIDNHSSLILHGVVAGLTYNF
jgi:opacity protein-like surface antigen